ncbi:unnamed protein product [Chilo suppressalis]|uniref:Uncharacterized protein n=1 Tax=Chilo suppressalis TaxID=168631 RepID=A0ABN8B2A8_CHISP|nr:unnamed protein product [Chilo suppressalis]
MYQLEFKQMNINSANNKLAGEAGFLAAVAKAAPRCAAVAHWHCLWLVGSVGSVEAQRSPLGWAMGSSQRLAAVAAISHSRNYYNHTQSQVSPAEVTHYTRATAETLRGPTAYGLAIAIAFDFILLFLNAEGKAIPIGGRPPDSGTDDVRTQNGVAATLCGVLVAVCAACWRRSPASDKPEEAPDCRGVYTVSADATLVQVHSTKMHRKQFHPSFRLSNFWLRPFDTTSMSMNVCSFSAENTHAHFREIGRRSFVRQARERVNPYGYPTVGCKVMPDPY